MDENKAIICRHLRHIGLPLPHDVFIAADGKKASLLELQVKFYESLGYHVDSGQEDESADRAGQARRWRVRDGSGQIIISFVESALERLQLKIYVRAMGGLHVCLSASPEHLEALLAHPNFERGPVSWGRGSKSVFLADPVGYEVEVQLINCPD